MLWDERAGQGERDETGLLSVSDTYDVTALAVALLVEGVEGLSSQTGVAGDACETLHVEHLLHGDAPAAIADHVVTTAGAASCKTRLLTFHLLQQGSPTWGPHEEPAGTGII